MGTLRVIALTIFFLLIVVGHAFALNEVFLFIITGTEYCEDFSHVKLSPRNTPLWIQILSDTEMIVSSTPTFKLGTTFPLNGSTYLTGKKRNKAVFTAGVSFENQSFFTIQGTLYLDRFNTVTFMEGIFIDNGVLHPSCSSQGKFWTKQD